MLFELFLAKEITIEWRFDAVYREGVHNFIFYGNDVQVYKKGDFYVWIFLKK